MANIPEQVEFWISIAIFGVVLSIVFGVIYLILFLLGSPTWISFIVAFISVIIISALGYTRGVKEIGELIDDDK